MSKRLVNNKCFITLLLNTTGEQSKALLYTITEDQVFVISEIFHNLNTLPLPTKTKNALRKRKLFVHKLDSHKLSWKTKRRFIEINYKFVLEIFLGIKTQLKSLLK